ncbi:cell division cycle protein 23 [Anaeramoeba flamelloides]|uniref:Cell division cycle protein 23 n=1 Tax=Anaeramoeba flamelloides TaxID=1746091 RepID=A0AAV8AHA3_9EUKA|nr:cell division cycle protein 23 [Anaeramoeba flamelloides]
MDKKTAFLAIRELNERCLYVSSKWLSTQIHSVFQNQTQIKKVQEQQQDQEQEKEKEKEKKKEKEQGLGQEETITIQLTGEDLDPTFQLARNLFQLKEYKRCSHLLEGKTTKKSFFLHCYSRYILGEQQRDERIQQEGNLLGTLGKYKNKELLPLYNLITNYQKKKKEDLDPFCEYVYALVLVGLEKANEAIQSLTKSINKFPYNWSCWLELSDLLETPRELSLLNFGEEILNNSMYKMFLCYFLVGHSKYEKVFELCNKLNSKFNFGTNILSLQARASYLSGDFDTAEELYKKLHKIDPLSLEGMDVYSNILFVNRKKAELSHLAHNCLQFAKYRPQTCIIVGNYFSLRGEHEKAITYFQRTLKLQLTNSSAWILMGHEYIELKNFSAAIQAYRRGVELAPRDYRAWYGLGHVYELLQLPLFALYYFNKTVQLRPFDSRLWCALGNCHESLGQIQNAIKCYQRAEQNKDQKGYLPFKHLANLFETIGEIDTAAFYWQKTLSMIIQLGSDELLKIQPLYFLAEYYKNNYEISKAKKKCEELLDIPEISQKSKISAQTLYREILAIETESRSNTSKRLSLSPSSNSKFEH